MTAVSTPLPQAASVVRPLALGALAVGVLDLLDAFVFFGLRGVSPVRICQAIAAGVLGRAAFQGGAATAALGVALHFFIATTIVLVYHAASRRMPALARRPFAWGPLYGVGVYLVMNWVVIPLSNAPGGTPRLSTLLNGVGIHILGVGIPAALAARAAARARGDALA